MTKYQRNSLNSNVRIAYFETMVILSADIFACATTISLMAIHRLTQIHRLLHYHIACSVLNKCYTVHKTFGFYQIFNIGLSNNILEISAA